MTNTKDKKLNCFVIMPFGGWFDLYYKEVYIPAIEAAGFVAKRADDLYRPGNIVNDIWQYTKEADVVLADLTNKNPNVFYELGLAHAIAKPAILITATMDDVPFDLRSLRVIEYNKESPKWGEILQNKITRALKETLSSPEKAIPPTFLEVSKSEKTTVSSEEKDILELRNELESFKREVRSSRDIKKKSISRFPTSFEAERFIREMLSKDISIELIRNTLMEEGVPEGWIDDAIDYEINGELNNDI